MSTTHSNTTTGESQCDVILDKLRRHEGRWVDMVDLHRASGSMAIHSRIADLRKRGHTIEQQNKRHGRTVHSQYRLLAAQEQPSLF